MSVTVVQYPKRLRSDGRVSKWVALHNPIIYKFQRKDYTILNITVVVFLGVPIINVTISTPLVSPDTFSVGDFVYISSGGYQGIFKIKGLGTPTNFIISAPNFGNTTGGTLNLNTKRNNYKVQVDILAVNNSNIYYVLGSAIVTPSPTGLMQVDIHEWIKELAGYANEYDYTTLNVKDKNLSNTFNVRFIESWQNNDTEVIKDAVINESMRHFFVNASKQIADDLGQNMGNYVPIPETQATKAFWLSGFEVPTVFRGYPFDMQFIYSDNVGAYIISRRTEQFDLNDNSLGVDAEPNLDVAGLLFVNRLKLPVINANAKSIEMFLNIVQDDSARIYSSGYAIDYADDYYELIDSPPIPSPPIEI